MSKEKIEKFNESLKELLEGEDMDNLVMVLNDEETYTGLSGCKIMSIKTSDEGLVDELVKRGESDEEPDAEVKTIVTF